MRAGFQQCDVIGIVVVRIECSRIVNKIELEHYSNRDTMPVHLFAFMLSLSLCWARHVGAFHSSLLSLVHSCKQYIHMSQPVQTCLYASSLLSHVLLCFCLGDLEDSLG